MKKCRFIRKDEKVYIPTPNSWLGGWARHRWLERYFKDETIVILSAESWSDLCAKNRYRILEGDHNSYYESAGEKSEGG